MNVRKIQHPIERAWENFPALDGHRVIAFFPHRDDVLETLRVLDELCRHVICCALDLECLSCSHRARTWRHGTGCRSCVLLLHAMVVKACA